MNVFKFIRANAPNGSKLIWSLLLTLAIGGIAAAPSFATPIDLGINGDVMVGPDFMYFASNYPMDTVFAPAAGYGNFQVSQVQAGNVLSAAGVSNGEFGSIMSLSIAMDPVKTSPDFTNGYSSSPFMTFSGNGSNEQLFLTALLQGSFAPGSPFSFMNTPNGVIAFFNIDGYLLNTITSQKTNYTGTFSATFNGVMSVSDLLTVLPIQTPFSATFTLTNTPSIPEPGSLLLMGAGLLGIGFIGRHRFIRKS